MPLFRALRAQLHGHRGGRRSDVTRLSRLSNPLTLAGERQWDDDAGAVGDLSAEGGVLG